MISTDPTAKRRWLAALQQVLPDPTRLPFHNVHLMEPFENAGYQGLLTAYPPEQEMDLTAVYRGKAEEVSWRHVPGLGGVLELPVDFSAWLPTETWSVLYLYTEVEVETPQIAELLVGSPGMVWIWVNGYLTLSPMILARRISRMIASSLLYNPGLISCCSNCILARSRGV